MSSQDHTNSNDVLSPEQYRENAEKKAALSASKQVIENHVDQMMLFRENFPLDDIDLISSGNIGARHDIPQEVKEKIGSMQSTIRHLIEEAAFRIEEYKYKNAEDGLSTMKLGYNDKQNIYALMGAERKVHTSFQALKVAVDFFSNLNEHISKKIQGAIESGNAKAERSLVLGNAILVYELTDFLISYINNFVMNGLPDVDRLYSQQKNEIEQLRNEENKNRQNIQSSADIDDSVKQPIIVDIENRLKSLDEIDREWDKYFEQISNLQGEAGSLTKKIPTLVAIRDNAKGQIKFLQAAAVMSIVKSNVTAVQGAISSLSGLKLVTLSPDRVRRLFGI